MPDTPRTDPAGEADPDDGGHNTPDQGPDLFTGDAETTPLASANAARSDPAAPSGGPAAGAPGPDLGGPPPGYPATPAYPPYPAPPGRARRWRRAWMAPALVGLLIGGALGAGIATAAEHHGPGDIRPRFRQFGPGPGFVPRYGPYRYAPRPGVPGRPGFPQRPGTPATPTPAPTTSG